MLHIRRILARATGAVLCVAGAAIPASADDPDGFSGQGLPTDTVLVQTSIGLPVSLPAADGGVPAERGSLQADAEARAAFVTRALGAEDLAVLQGEGPRILTWDVDAEAITSVDYRRTQVDPSVLAPGLNCTDSANDKSCIFRSSGSSRSLTGRNDVTDPMWSSTYSTMFAGPRNAQSEVCAGGTGSSNCQGLPADYFMEFVGVGETIYRVKHF